MYELNDCPRSVRRKLEDMEKETQVLPMSTHQFWMEEIVNKYLDENFRTNLLGDKEAKLDFVELGNIHFSVEMLD